MYIADGAGSGTWTTLGSKILQRSFSRTLLHTSLTTALPSDGTTPQSTEGDAIFSVSFTPQSASSKIYIRANVLVQNGGSGNASIALFRSTSCLASNYTTVNSQPTPLSIDFSENSPGTSAVTYSLRGGGSTGAITLNGSASVDLGPTVGSTFFIEEVL